MRRLLFAVLALALVLSVRTSAQMPTAQKWENAEWYYVMSWQFAQADADSSMTLLFDYFMPAIKDVWPDMKCFRHVMGEWHITCFGPMIEGPASLEWQTSPEEIAFMTALMERHGESMMEVVEWYFKTITRSTSSFGLDPTGGM